MAIEVTCECGKLFRAKDEYAGRRGICPACRREFVIEVPIDPPVDIAAPCVERTVHLPLVRISDTVDLPSLLNWKRSENSQPRGQPGGSDCRRIKARLRRSWTSVRVFR